MKFFTVRSLACCLLLLSCSTIIFAQSSSRFSYERYTNGNKDTLQYRMLYPDADTFRRYPLVIFLHGSGERGNDNEAQLKWGVGNFATDRAMAMYPAIVIAPQCPMGQGWSSFTTGNAKAGTGTMAAQPSKSMALLMELIRDIIKKQRIDTNRIYITGMSMGGFGTFDAIERYPNVFAAAVPVCGGGDISKAASIAAIPLWIFHGAEDPAVNPQFSISMLGALSKAGAHPGFTLYPEVGHFSWLQAYSDPLMMEWLFRQRK